MRYKLLAKHYIDDRLLEPGASVGDGCDVSFKDPFGNYRTPSDQMEPEDDEARAAFDAFWNGKPEQSTDANSDNPSIADLTPSPAEANKKPTKPSASSLL